MAVHKPPPWDLKRRARPLLQERKRQLFGGEPPAEPPVEQPPPEDEPEQEA